jgi:hypothetical protein
VHFNNIAVPPGRELWVTAVFTPLRPVSLVTFENITVFLTPKPGVDGDSATATGPDSSITFGPGGDITCDAADYLPELNMYNITSSLNNSGGSRTLLAATNIVALFNLAEYSAVM